VIPGDAQVGARRRRGQKRRQQQGERRDAHGSFGKPGEPVGTSEWRAEQPT
jgi:hypothetical protein